MLGRSVRVCYLAAMKARLGIGSLLVLATASAIFFIKDRAQGGEGPARPENDAGPWIEWDETTHDFGYLFMGDVHTHVFSFRNRGRAPLRILDTKKECGCTKPIFDRKVIEPGGSGRMTVSFTPPIAGRIEKRIWVYTNDDYARESIVRLEVSGKGTADLEPRIVDLEGVEVPPTGLRRELILTLADTKRIQGVTVNCENPWMTVTRIGELGSNSTTLALDIAPPSFPTRLREQIPVFITAMDEAGKQTTFALAPTPLQVTGRVSPTAHAEPSVVHFGVLSRDAERTRAIRLRGDAVAVAEVRIEGHDGASIEESETGVYTLKMASSGKSGRQVGRAVFRLKDGTLLTVPFHAWISS